MEKSVLAAAFLALLLAPLAAADCPFLAVSLLDQASVAKGNQAFFPISVTNEGLADALVMLSGSCPSDLDCSFAPTPSYVTLSASQSAVFNLVAGTQDADLGSHAIGLNISVGANPAPCYNKQLKLEVLAAPPQNLTRSSFTVSLEPGGLNSSGWAGDTLEYTVKITNNEDNVGYAELSLEGPFADSTTFSASRVTIQPHATKEVKARVTIPPGTPGSVYDNVVLVKATAGGACCEQQYPLPLKVCVFADNLRLAMYNEPVSCTKATHNKESRIELELRNDGEISGPFRAYLVGSSKALGIMALSADLLEIEPGDRLPLTVSILPDQGAVLDTYYYSLKIDYLGFTVYDRPFCFTVSGVEDFAVDYNASSIIKRCKVETLPIYVTNNGTLADDYEIEAGNVSGMLIQPVPAAFSLSPGASKRVDVVISTTLRSSPESATMN